MGKILDSLVRTMQTQKPRPQAIKPPVRQTPDAAEIGGSEPSASFIEVGAPNKRIDGSADVLAVPMRSTFTQPIAPPSAPSQPRPAKVHSIPTPALLEPRPQITLESWPTPASLRVPAEVVTWHQPDHPATRDYARLVARLQGDGANPHCILLSGLTANAEAATLALNLAFQAARNPELQIALVDAGGSSTLSRLTDNGLGLHDVLAGKAALADAMQSTPCDNLRLVNLRPDARLSREALQWAFCWLRQRFQWICMAGPTADALCPSIMRMCDQLYLVAAPDHTGEVTPLADSLIAKGATIGGIIKWTLPTLD